MSVGTGQSRRAIGVRFCSIAVCVGPMLACDTVAEMTETVLHGTTAIVLVDVSRTVPAGDTSIYATSFRAVKAALRPGDRLVMGRVAAQSEGSFLMDAHLRLPRTLMEPDDSKARDSVLALADSVFAFQLASRRADQTNLLAALSAAADVFSRGRSRGGRILVLLSDMLHEADGLNFRSRPPDSAVTAALIAERRRANAMPALSGVRVYVAGAGQARDASGFFAVQRFWLSYFREAGAYSDNGTYGRSALTSVR